MAPYFYDPNLDQEDHINNNPSSVQISGAAPTVNDQGSAQANPNNNNQGLNTGSGFQNLDKYLQVNNAQDFGQKFQGKVSDQVQGAETQMNQAADQFKDQVQSANKLPNQEQITQAIANPTQANPKEFQDWAKQSYSGPHDISENQDVWNKYWSGVNQAQTNTKLLGSEPGRFTLLDQYFGRPSYNFGEKSLDNLLYQESGLGNQTKALQDQAARLTTQGQDKALELRGDVSDRVKAVDENRNNVLNAIGLNADRSVKTGDNAGAIGKEWQSVDDQLAQTNADRHAQQERLRENLSGGVLTPDQIKALGLDSDQQLYDLNLNDYLTNNGDLNRDQVMTPEQRARIQALTQLAGITDTFASNNPLDPTSAARFDHDTFNSKINTTRANLQSELADLMKDQGMTDPAEWHQHMTNYVNSDNFATPEGKKAALDDLSYYDYLMKKYQTDRKIGEKYYNTSSGPIGRTPSIYGSLPGTN